MDLTLKTRSRNGKYAIYSGAAVALRLPLHAFPDKTAPETISVVDGAFAPAKAPKEKARKLTKEERAALPKPTLAERIAKREAQIAKDKAKLAAQQASEASL